MCDALDHDGIEKATKRRSNTGEFAAIG